MICWAGEDKQPRQDRLFQQPTPHSCLDLRGPVKIYDRVSCSLCSLFQTATCDE